MLKTSLYPYQVPAVEFLIHRGSLLLAYGPGTGKTICTIAAAEMLLDDDDINYCLVLCPASLKYQWAARIRQFTDSSVVIIEGNKVTRSKEYVLASVGGRYRYIIASHDTVINDYDSVCAIRPDMVVLDEASAIKSFKPIRSKRIKKLFKDVPYRLALTATPIENKPDELFSIMQFVDSSVLGRYDLFDKAYINRNKRGWVESYKNLDILHERLGDSMLRKTRHDPDVVDYLPDVDEADWVVPILPEYKKIYDAIALDMLSELNNLDSFTEFDVAAYSSGEDSGTPPGRLMAMHMCLEMLLDHPALIEWSANGYDRRYDYGSEYAWLLLNSISIPDSPTPAKLSFLSAKLDEILSDPSSKVIVYSKYKYMLNLLQDYFDYYGSVTYDGDMSSKEKDKAVQEFTNNPECRLFFSSYAGGYGLDLYMADYLINYDLPWSFGAQDQINNRHVRASSKFSKVYVRNIITQDSIEERKMRILNRKREISHLAIDGKQSDITQVDVGFDYLGDHLREVTGQSQRKGVDKRARA